MTVNNNDIGYFLRLFPENPEYGTLSVVCRRGQYSASAIARAVEDADAHLVNLNVTGSLTDAGDNIVELRVSHRNTAAVARSLARYGFDVIAADGDADPAFAESPTAQNPLAALQHYLDI